MTRDSATDSRGLRWPFCIPSSPPQTPQCSLLSIPRRNRVTLTPRLLPTAQPSALARLSTVPKPQFSADDESAEQPHPDARVGEQHRAAESGRIHVPVDVVRLTVVVVEQPGFIQHHQHCPASSSPPSSNSSYNPQMLEQKIKLSQLQQLQQLWNQIFQQQVMFLPCFLSFFAFFPRPDHGGLIGWVFSGFRSRSSVDSPLYCLHAYIAPSGRC